MVCRNLTVGKSPLAFVRVVSDLDDIYDAMSCMIPSMYIPFTKDQIASLLNAFGWALYNIKRGDYVGATSIVSEMEVVSPLDTVFSTFRACYWRSLNTIDYSVFGVSTHSLPTNPKVCKLRSVVELEFPLGLVSDQDKSLFEKVYVNNLDVVTGVVWSDNVEICCF
jgi:hypothetical protein